MRPVNRGDWPKNDQGEQKKFHPYREARHDLRQKLGQYCSYCERYWSNASIEHLLPKDYYPEYEEDWNNFLFACINCNSTKGIKPCKNNQKTPNKNLSLEMYYWPDRDNTSYIFDYEEEGIIEVNPNLDDGQKKKAQETLALTGLDRHALNLEKPPSDDDFRWVDRMETWGIATRKEKQLKKYIVFPIIKTPYIFPILRSY